MPEQRPEYNAGQLPDRLVEIKRTMAAGGVVDPADLLWLVGEVERLTDGLILRDAFFEAIGADVDKVLMLGGQHLMRAALKGKKE